VATRGIDEVLMPGQVAALERRIQLLVPERDRCLQELANASDDAVALGKAGNDAREAERAVKRSARLRIELATLTGEMDTLRSLVAARWAQSARRG
jgi:hypothetical protein